MHLFSSALFILEVLGFVVALMGFLTTESRMESRYKRQRIRGVTITLYQDEFFNTVTGASYELVIAFNECTNLDEDWNDQVSSIDPAGACIIVYADKFCQGRSARLTRTSFGSNKLTDIHFNDEISSLKTC